MGCYLCNYYSNWLEYCIYLYQTTSYQTRKFSRYLQENINTIVILLFVTNWVLFINKARVNEILNRYKLESVTSMKIGNILLYLYIFIPLGLILFA